MKKLNRKLIKGTNWALAGLLTLLGFSGCSDDDDDGGLVAEYGTPMASFVVKGKITDTDGKTLEGIQVVVPTVDHYQVRPGVVYDKPVITAEVHDTLYTKSNGEFEYKYSSGTPTDTVRIHMKFEDILTEPRFSSDSTNVSFLPEDLKGGGRWNKGEAEKSVQVKLKKK